ncbi:DEAD/DEAH box helicase [Photobacterium rosenbergii]|uniref:DEAD/DEAH box helicase n=1 Tax=Photobacterium rosenbergii TaxID=294936 RepID=UPI001C9920A7|nr:DEAD/DEAH box helicase [Photobacterium rosenbergii]MBY5946833.1 DEAD/DEAH box helicase [Photobacterium rosenbergii]
MLPSVISNQVVNSLKKYIKAAFNMNSPCFESDEYSMIDSFLSDTGNLIKGPYLSVQLPFRQSDLSQHFFSHFDLPFPPYAHQAIAYERLGQQQPQSTLIATGTGSGKTECFLYPLLNHCADNEAPGVKAIVIYPMNALATDQAKRFASTIFNNDGLKGKVTVGLFVGGQESGDAATSMSSDQVITCKHHLRDNPPDILLTNYKMLDYLLIRPEDQSLWSHNSEGTLRFLVVDELHTFDGAQGSDLACLIRRLKFHLSVDSSKFACVGTSATVGDELGPLIDYASDIFDSEFEEASVVKEDRYRYEEYLAAADISEFTYPPFDEIERLNPANYDSEVSYINQQIAFWFPEFSHVLPADIETDEGRMVRVELGKALMAHRFFHSLLQMLNGQIKSMSSIVASISPAYSISENDAERVVQSFVSLVSIARREIAEEESQQAERLAKGKARPVLPFLQVRNQLWLRELRRLVASVSKKPQLNFGDDISDELSEKYLPVVNCRDCHVTGWGGYVSGYSEQFETQLDVFYRLFFNGHHSIRVALPINDDNDPPAKGIIRRACTRCLAMNKDSDKDECTQCGHVELVRVFIPDLVKASEKKGPHFSNSCPYCNSKNGLSIIGAQSATLSSVAINQIYGSKYNENKKLITFSDSVQDAAHRAGFFAARTWPLMVRSHIGTVAQQSEGKNLAEFAGIVVKEALAQSGSSESFVANFIAPNMEWLNDYRNMVDAGESGSLQTGSMLPKWVENRLNWEVCSEFGMRASIGRTLERTSEVTFDVCSEELIDALSRLYADLSHELGDEFTGVSDKDVFHFALGVLHRMRHKGAVVHESLHHYIREGGETYYLTKIDKQTSRYMPNWGNKTRTPAFLTFGKNKRFDQLLGSKTRKSWYQNWLTKCFSTDSNVMVSSHEMTIYTMLMKALQRVGVVAEFDSKGQQVWGIEQRALSLTNQVVSLGCDACTESVSVPGGSINFWVDQPCHNENCCGSYSKQKEPQSKEWSSSEAYRVNAAEHTGLLERKSRELTEDSFIKGNVSWSVNLLSATPTLEMGIDIGDLSSVLLCSVPPAQANYLQRIGRAGRKDGNAFNLTVAAGNPHDLYFYQDPLDMMSGSVAAPGVFLDASAILERQLTAFCMDCWIKTGVGSEQISKRVKQMLDACEGELTDRYPFNFLHYVDQNKEDLFNLFVLVFNSLSETSTNKLRDFILGSDDQYGLAAKIQQSLELLVKDRKSLISRANKLKRSIDKLKESPVKDKNFQDDLNELENERNALLALVREINGKDTLNFMTDEGLLPNYAFPEAGITLRSVLWRKKENVELEDGQSQYVTKTFEYERPAAAAISELAPTNHFYAGGHKVEIEQIDMKVSEPETWRVCSHCNHSELLEADQYSSCPKCDHPGWGDAEQKMRLLKLRQVYARSNVRDARISDDADTRTPSFFQRQLLVSFKPDDVEYAYEVDNADVPFGFEYLSRVSLRDINFGSAAEDATEFYVAGEKKKKTGFKVCSDCGVVQKPNAPENHDISCKYKNSPLDAKFEDFLYLYRQLESEAIRILLPVSNYGAGEVTEASLSAALQLGMKSYFKGSVDHIKGTIYKEPEDAGESYRHYLVIYDSVPGGTGALKELMQDASNLLKLLGMALEHINKCECNLEDKDGCYQCVYAYRDRGKMRAISRDHARKLLTTILEHEDELKPIRSLSDISINVMLESELERLFIETLQQASTEFIVSKDYIHDKAGWTVSSKLNAEVAWHLVPQVHLGGKDGIAIDTRPDFVLYPASGLTSVKPIAIYLDGYEHHYNIVSDDVTKRNAVLESNKYHVWTLCWHDLVNPDAKHLKEVFGLSRSEIKKKEPHYNLFNKRNYETLRNVYENRNSFVLLKRYMHEPANTSVLFKEATFANSFYWLSIKGSKDVAIKNKFVYEMKENADLYRQEELCLDKPYFFGGLLDAVGTSLNLIEVAAVMPAESYVYVAKKQVKGQEPCDYAESVTRLHICFDDRYTDEDGYEQALNGFWKLVNIGQFSSDFSFTSRKVLREVPVTEPAKDTKRKEPTDSSCVSSGSDHDEAWQEIIELEILEQESIDMMISMGIPAPEVGFELRDEAGEIVADAELAWPEIKIALILPDMDEFFPVFEGQGWTPVVGELDEKTMNKLQDLMG